MLRISEYIRDSLAEKPWRSFNGVILIWNLTNTCNLTCAHCYASAIPKPQEEISTERALELVSGMKRAGVRHAILSGGEPLLRKDLFEIAAGLRAEGIVVSLSTNGLLVKENIPRRTLYWRFF